MTTIPDTPPTLPTAARVKHYAIYTCRQPGCTCDELRIVYFNAGGAPVAEALLSANEAMLHAVRLGDSAAETMAKRRGATMATPASRGDH